MACDLTGISNINEFYSHHYLDSLLEGDLRGLYKKWQENEERSPYEKLSGVAQKYFKAKTDAFNEKKPEDRVEVTNKFNINFLESLGYNVQQKIKFTEGGRALPVLSTVSRGGNEHLWVIETVFWADDVSIFEQPMVFNNLNDIDNWFVDSLDIAIQEIFRLEEPPRWLILLAGQKVYLIDRHKWGHGKYLLFDLDEIFGRKQTETLKATAALLSKDALAPEEGNILHDELDENSHKHAFSVSEDLKYGIRRAVELIGNEFILYRSKVAKQKIYGDEELANKLTKECLNYLYRLLFLFYAESRSEQLNVVPMKSEEYRLGYSLETLRELELVPLTTEASREGYFLHESLTTLFKIVNDGFGNDDQFEADYESGNFVDIAFRIDGLQSPLFDPKQTPLLSSVKFRNYFLQEVIQLLSLSKQGSKQRGRISYAQLGINQLGAVYEGLLSYSGFFAQETLYEVKPADVSSTDETGQSYFVPESDINQYKDDEFVLFKDDDGINRRKKYEKGSFIFRLAGRDREKSASYYTPEVLTQSLVKYSLKELLKNKTADEILELTICEPAMGSGAFLNEAINQLADAYLLRKQEEVGESITPDDYGHEKQRVKAFIATNNIYGVDLNPTAVELAKVSLWLNIIYEGSKTPWFSYRFAVGNSLLSARKQVFKGKDLISGNWHNKVPETVSSLKNRDNDSIYHFLIPDKAMVSFDKDKVVKSIEKENIEYMKQWRNEFTKKYSKDEVETLKTLSKIIDELWKRHGDQRKNLLINTNEPINIWGKRLYESEKRYSSIETKEVELNKIINSPTSPFNVLKMVMDYWCALWVWPIEKAYLLPSRDEFLLEISVILDAARGYGPNLTDLVNTVERFSVISKISNTVRFFHWELYFAEIFNNKHGFDLIVGNPPWIKFTWEERGILSERFPVINLKKLSAQQVSKLRNELISDSKGKTEYLEEFAFTTGQKSFLSSYLYNELQGVQLNLYKSFMLMSIKLANSKGLLGFLHLEGIYDDAQGEKLREYLFPKMIYHFQYINELKLFPDIGNQKKYGCSIYSPSNKETIEFINISNLFHPKTIDESFSHNGEGIVPGFKTNNYEWELKGHSKRIIKFDFELLKSINKMYEEEGVKIEHTKLINIHSTLLSSVINKLSKYDKKLVKYKEQIFDTEMFHETNDQKSGNIIRNTTFVNDISHFVYSGPHFYVGNPIYQTPNEGCKSHRDYSKIDLLEIDQDYLPRTNYLLSDEAFNDVPNWKGKKITDYYRIAFRKMLSPTGERTLIGAIIPKLPSHINACISLGFNNNNLMALFSGMCSSILLDFYIRSTGRTNLSKVIYNLPIPSNDNVLNKLIISRALRLNCLTEFYSGLWEELYKPLFNNDSFSKADNRLSDWKNLKAKWTPNIAFRNDFERRLALVEIDVLSALVLNLTYEELVTIYKVQFPVLQKYELENHYDQRGMLVPKNILNYYTNYNGNVEEKDPNLEGYLPPFDKCDREKDMRQAYEYFSKILNEEKAKGEINV
ncbi:Eco57I restriction-modification methylase domain-containing protein [Metabacillus idriensis]|uniref:Eco57I restriction-modification methylase domain-containing protein n=1 Tax=Metabacillus idriensis TaxID=324768 RepID=UPI003D2D80FA